MIQEWLDVVRLLVEVDCYGEMKQFCQCNGYTKSECSYWQTVISLEERRKFVVNGSSYRLVGFHSDSSVNAYWTWKIHVISIFMLGNTNTNISAPHCVSMPLVIPIVALQCGHQDLIARFVQAKNTIKNLSLSSWVALSYNHKWCWVRIPIVTDWRLRGLGCSSANKLAVLSAIHRFDLLWTRHWGFFVMCLIIFLMSYDMWIEKIWNFSELLMTKLVS